MQSTIWYRIQIDVTLTYNYFFRNKAAQFSGANYYIVSFGAFQDHAQCYILKRDDSGCGIKIKKMIMASLSIGKTHHACK